MKCERKRDEIREKYVSMLIARYGRRIENLKIMREFYSGGISKYKLCRDWKITRAKLDRMLKDLKNEKYEIEHAERGRPEIISLDDIHYLIWKVTMEIEKKYLRNENVNLRRFSRVEMKRWISERNAEGREISTRNVKEGLRRHSGDSTIIRKWAEILFGSPENLSKRELLRESNHLPRNNAIAMEEKRILGKFKINIGEGSDDGNQVCPFCGFSFSPSISK